MLAKGDVTPSEIIDKAEGRLTRFNTFRESFSHDLAQVRKQIEYMKDKIRHNLQESGRNL